MNTKSHVDFLESGLPRPLIEAAIAVMVAAAMLSYTPVADWMRARIPFIQALVNTLGMVVAYYACLRGMRPLQHPLTVLWWVVIGFNIVGFALYWMGDDAAAVNAAFATALPLAYLPLGVLLMVWYRGNLERVGLWMVIRILVVNLVPVAFFLLGLLEKTSWMIVQEVITIGVELVYVWTLRRVLVQ